MVAGGKGEERGFDCTRGFYRAGAKPLPRRFILIMIIIFISRHPSSSPGWAGGGEGIKITMKITIMMMMRMMPAYPPDRIRMGRRFFSLPVH
jgi:hypothetical protein